MDFLEIVANNHLEAVWNLFPADERRLFVPMVFQKNSLIILKDAPVEYAYVLIDGMAVLLSEMPGGQVYSFAKLYPGCIIGDLEVLSSQMKNAGSLIAGDRCVCLRFPVDRFRELLRNDHSFLLYVAQSLAERMFTRSYEAGIDIYMSGVDRLMVSFVKYYSSHSKETENTIRVEKTQRELATEIGVSVKTIGRCIGQLRAQNLINMRHGKSCITHAQYQEMLNRTSDLYIDYLGR